LRMIVCVVLLCLMVGLSTSVTDNYCKPIVDFTPREDRMEERPFCSTRLQEVCEVVSETGCLEVDSVVCDVVLTTDCSVTTFNLTVTNSVPVVGNATLQECSKEMTEEFHEQLVYECRNVTKTHCTTLWEMKEDGTKVWAGNDDCSDIVFEECEAVKKQVPFPVPSMTCTGYNVPYVDFEAVTTQQVATTSDCEVIPLQVCQSAREEKCGQVEYLKCTQVAVEECQSARIIVPAQEEVHKQWCLFDQAEDRDFDQDVRDILSQEQEVTEIPSQEQEVTEIINQE